MGSCSRLKGLGLSMSFRLEDIRRLQMRFDAGHPPVIAGSTRNPLVVHVPIIFKYTHVLGDCGSRRGGNARNDEWVTKPSEGEKAR